MNQMGSRLFITMNNLYQKLKRGSEEFTPINEQMTEVNLSSLSRWIDVVYEHVNWRKDKTRCDVSQ